RRDAGAPGARAERVAHRLAGGPDPVRAIHGDLVEARRDRRLVDRAARPARRNANIAGPAPVGAEVRPEEASAGPEDHGAGAVAEEDGRRGILPGDITRERVRADQEHTAHRSR